MVNCILSYLLVEMEIGKLERHLGELLTTLCEELAVNWHSLNTVQYL